MLSRSHTVLFLSIVCAAGMAYFHLALFVPRAIEVRGMQGLSNGYSFGADFYPLWLTARESRWHHRGPYDPQTTRQIQIDLFGRPLGLRSSDPADDRAFANPAFTILLLWPLTLLPFPVARIALALILPAATAVSIVAWLGVLRQRVGAAILTSLMLLTLSSYPVMEGLYAEQIGLLVGLLQAAAVGALVKKKYFLSGSLLALTLVKPQMTILLAGYLLVWSFSDWQRRRRFAYGFFLISTSLLISSLWVWPRWIPEWLQLLANYSQHSVPPLMEYLLGDTLGSRLGPVLIGAALLSAVAVGWRMRSASQASDEFAMTVSLLLAITCVAVLPGHAVYDHVILFPGILLIASQWRFFERSRPSSIILGLGLVALFWQWILALCVITLRPVVSPQLFNSTLLWLPVCTAASIPFMVCALLALLITRATHKPLRTEGSVVGSGEGGAVQSFSARSREARFFDGKLTSADRARAT
jgi:hypothetical protein